LLMCTLPAEIGSIIFLYAIGIDIFDPLMAAHRRRTLCLVCSPWPKIIYGTPRTWNRVKVLFNGDQKVDVVRTCLINSKSIPLEMELEIRGTIPIDEHSAMLYSQRVQSFLHTYFSLLKSDFACILKLHIVCPDSAGSVLVQEYLAHMDCRIVAEISLVLVLPSATDNALHHPSLASAFPSLRSLDCIKSFPPASSP
jgi:hypothetical protein